jgi:hypothetical protein
MIIDYIRTLSTNEEKGEIEIFTERKCSDITTSAPINPDQPCRPHQLARRRSGLEDVPYRPSEALSASWSGRPAET